MAKRVGVVLAGCGYLDGSEIHESVALLTALDRGRAEVFCFAPNIFQAHVVNHLDGQEAGDHKRNVLEESARIARGAVKPVSEARLDDLDALCFPGGFGAAKNICDFAFKGADYDVIPEVKSLVQAFYSAKKPIAACCIAPMILAKSLEGKGIELSIGNDPDTAGAIEGLGHKHVNTLAREAHADIENKIVTTGAYMFGGVRISEVADGIEAMVNKLLDLT